MLSNFEEINELCLKALKDKYGQDFEFEEGDDVVFTLNNGVLILSYEQSTLSVKVVLEEAIPIQAEFKLE